MIAELAAKGWLRRLMAPLWPTFREVVILSLFVNVLALAVPVFVMQVYDRVIFHAGLETLQALLLGIACVLVFDWVLRQCRARILQRISVRIDVAVGRQLFDTLVSLPLATLESRPAAHWQALFRDADVIRNTLSGATAIMICDLPFAALFLGLVFVIAEPVAWVLVLALPLFLTVALLSGRSMLAAHQGERDSGLARDELLTELLAGRTTVKALGLERALRPLWEARHADCIDRALRRGSAGDGYSNIGTTLTMLTTVAMTAVGAVAIIHQTMSIGALIASNMLSGRLLGVFNQLVANWRAYAGFFQSARRLGQLFTAERERQESPVRLPRPRGAVTIERLEFTYVNGRRAIDAIEISIGPGGAYGLVGRNGSGKSTLLKLIQGLYRPSAGRVLLDGADVTQFARADLVPWIGYVPQDCTLFAGTIRDNVALRSPDASDEDIVRAGTLAGVHDFIIDLPDGYGTSVGEAGRLLSAGQRQRLVIARALLGDPPLLLLDEPTSHLDRDAELEMRGLLMTLQSERTIIIATHSMGLLSLCRTIVQLESGRIWRVGPADVVLTQIIEQAGGPTTDAATTGGRHVAAEAAIAVPAARRRREAAG